MADETKFLGPLLGGIREDVEPFLIPLNAAVKVENFDLSGKYLKKSYGISSLGSSLASIPLGIVQFTTFDGILHTVVVTEDDILAWDGVTSGWVSIMSTTWACTFSTLPSFACINNVLLMTNHTNVIQVWDGNTATASDVSGSPAYYPRMLDTFKDHVLLIGGAEGATERPQRIRWPAVGTYDGFSTPGNGYFDLLDTPGAILAGKKFAQFYVVYKTDSVSVMQYIGGTSIFTANTIVSGTGIIAEKALLEVTGTHWFLGSDGGGYLDIFEFSGTNVLKRVGAPVGDLLKKVQRDYMARSFAVKYGSKCCFAVPIDSEYPDTWLVYDEENKNWSTEKRTAVCASLYLHTQVLTIGSLLGTIGDLQGLIGDLGLFAKSPQILLGDLDKVIYCCDAQYTQVRGGSIESIYESGDIIFLDSKGNWETYRLRGFDFYCRGAGSLELQYSLDNGETWLLPVTASQTVESSRQWLKFDIDVLTNIVRFKLTHTGGSIQIQGGNIRRLPEVVVSGA